MSGLPATGRALLLDPSTRDDPSRYGRLLAEAPVLRTGGLWLVSGYQQVSRLAGDPRLVIDPRAGDPPLPLTQSEQLELIFGRMLSFRDGAPTAACGSSCPGRSAPAAPAAWRRPYAPWSPT